MNKVVVIINNFAVGGVERLFLDILGRLDRDKVSVEVVTVWGSGPLRADYANLGIPIHFLAGQLEFSKKNPLLKPYFTIIAPITLLRLLLLLRRIKPDVTITCLNQADIIGTLAAWLSRVPTRIVRQADVVTPSAIVAYLKKHWAFGLCTQVIANSFNTKKFVEESFSVASNRIVVIPNGVNFRHFSKGIKSEGEISLGFIGRIEPIKGVDYLVDALGILQEKFLLSPPVLIVGEGSQWQKLQAKIQGHGLDRVSLIGESSDVVDALSKIDILVLPSLSEGFGIAALEGIAAHKVVVASDLPAFCEFISPNKNGVIVPPKDAATLAQALANLLNHPELIENIRHNITHWIADEGQIYDIENVAKKYQAMMTG